MTPAASDAPVTAIRGALINFRGDPFLDGVDAARHHESDAIVAMQGGIVIGCGPAREIAAQLPPGTAVTHYADALITAGFIDTHVHYPQIPVIGAGGKPLLDWLEAYTFPAEQRYEDAGHARTVARLYLAENLRHGITSAAVFGTVHPHSVDVLFEEASAAGLRLIAGKVLMDRNAPVRLLDTAQRGYDESKQLIARWHGRGRLAYAITPRFAATSTPAQLEAAGVLWKESPGTYVQSHIAENVAELRWIRELFPEHARYLDVYGDHGLLGRRAIYAHGIHLDETELATLSATGTAIAHCPTSNNFLGSGQFDLARARDARRPVRVGLATDLGGGTHFCMLRTMQAACEIAQLRGHPLAPAAAWWLATAGAADALDLAGRVGNIAVGCDADIAVLDLAATPLLAFRMRHVRDIDEALAVLMALGDDRMVRATYVAGRLAWERQATGRS